LDIEHLFWKKKKRSFEKRGVWGEKGGATERGVSKRSTYFGDLTRDQELVAEKAEA